jgi:hypothetical protein
MIAANWSPEPRQLRQFAVAALPGFGLVGYAVLRATGALETAAVIWIFGAFVSVLGLAWPGAVRPLYLALTALTLPIGLVLSQVLLRVFFYGVVTPIGLVFKLFGRDSLGLRGRRSDGSYWTPHAQRTDPRTYYRQA